MHYKKVIKLLSSLIILISLIMLIPTFLALLWHETLAFKSFLITSILMILSGQLMKFLTRDTNLEDVSQRDGYLFTSLAWIVASAFGALPLIITETLPYFSDAFFEIISGFTTTGATRLEDIESCYKSILFWRSLTNWLGGMGIVVLFVAFLPAIGSGAGAFNLMGAETVGPIKGKLTPKTRTTAVYLYLIYVGMSVLQVILLLFGGISLFDAVTITFSTVSTAGFSIKNASIEAYNSAYIECIVIFFMVAASINFSLYYKAFTGHIKDALKDTEQKVYILIISTASLLGALFLWITGFYGSFGTALRNMAFQITSIISTTGFCNGQFLDWPGFAISLIIVTMFIGGCAGSTGGGMKVIRIHVVLKASFASIKKKIHPNAVHTLTVDNHLISEDTVSSIFSFVFIYLFTLFISTLVLSLTGFGMDDCLSSTLLTLGNIGLGFGHIPFYEYPRWTNWIFSFLMLSGRLELITVYILLSRNFWKR